MEIVLLAGTTVMQGSVPIYRIESETNIPSQTKTIIEYVSISLARQQGGMNLAFVL